ncbi:MAG TPA: hypothetical protein VND01_00010 [Candidatus Acidoferrales bacterium]|nr:hypothetical protein [Candidatus Acidoferrales bacterium]
MNTQDKLTLVSKITKSYRGSIHELERAIGVLFIGDEFGWKVLYLCHDKKTLRKYEEILGVDFREIFPERGPLARKSLGLALADKAGEFWKAAKGGIPGIRTPELK